MREMIKDVPPVKLTRHGWHNFLDDSPGWYAIAFTVCSPRGLNSVDAPNATESDIRRRAIRRIGRARGHAIPVAVGGMAEKGSALHHARVAA